MKLLGETRYEMLEQRCNRVIKMYKSDKAEMYKHYLSEKERLIKARKDGNMDYIELVNYF